jgi:hypothetical protein
MGKKGEVLSIRLVSAIELGEKTSFSTESADSSLTGKNIVLSMYYQNRWPFQSDLATNSERRCDASFAMALA